METAIKATDAFYRACDFKEKGVVNRWLVKEKGTDQSAGDLFCYTFKQWLKKDHFYNKHGGKDYNEEVRLAPCPERCECGGGRVIRMPPLRTRAFSRREKV